MTTPDDAPETKAELDAAIDAEEKAAAAEDAAKTGTAVKDPPKATKPKATKPKRLTVKPRSPDSGRKKTEKKATYWFGFIPVGQKPDPEADPLDGPVPLVDAPELRPYPPYFNRTIGGQTFLEYVNPVVRKDPQTGEHEKAILYGLTAELTESEVREVWDALEREFVRWHTRGDKRPHGQPVVIPKDAYVEEAEEEARVMKKPAMRIRSPFIEPSDVSISDYVYFAKREDRGASFPAPVSKTGIELP